MSMITRTLGALAFLLIAVPAFAQTSPVGYWKSFEDGEPKSIVKIESNGGVLTGAIVSLLPVGRLCGQPIEGWTARWNSERDKHMTEKCEPYPADGPVSSQRRQATLGTDMRGFVVLNGFRANTRANRWDRGTAFKPDDGGIYSGYMQVLSNGRLKLTGQRKVLGITFSKSQEWQPVSAAELTRLGIR